MIHTQLMPMIFQRDVLIDLHNYFRGICYLTAAWSGGVGMLLSQQVDGVEEKWLLGFTAVIEGWEVFKSPVESCPGYADPLELGYR